MLEIIFLEMASVYWVYEAPQPDSFFFS